jgi:histidinol-phosphate phosphatase family protein
MMQPGVFLDRDGVINYNPPSYVKSWEEFLFLPRVLEALELLAQTPWPIVIVTNQSVVGRGIIVRKTLDLIHERMIEEIVRAGGRIDGIFVCPHPPEAGCFCRKPEPGLLLNAAADLKIDLSKSILIGDSESDMIAARKIGVLPVMVKQDPISQGVDVNDQGKEADEIIQVNDLFHATYGLILAAKKNSRPVDMIYYLPEKPGKYFPGEMKK